MDYKDTTEFLYSLYRHGIKLGLESIGSALHALGNPQHRYKTLHVGGTNGKGSTAAILAKILQVAGYRVGLYTSPHLVDFRERIRVNEQLISENQVVALTQQVQSTIPIGLTFFEFTTAIAFQYFADEAVDIAVVEVGMGGRFDATNVLTPLGVVITSISYDHESYLGLTLSEIAFEKAGIIKPDTPVILGDMPVEAETVIREEASSRQAPCYGLGTEFHVFHEPGERFRYEGIETHFSHLYCSLLGNHQMNNAGCALALLEHVSRRGLNIQEAMIRMALSQVVWPGRLEILEDHPRLIIDGAHNPAAGKVLVDALVPMLHKDDARLIVVLAMMRDKDCAKFLKLVCPFVDHLILTEMSMTRAATVHELRQHVPEGHFTLNETPQLAEALKFAKQLAKSSDVICVTGSLFLVGEVRHLLKTSQSSSST
ncbi:MAG: bifunctional folylpolyglutamate synthase/dihydrofolate synthase [Nitrospirales bacterium]|nr:MAG: bifunctional folylpolyglutamate synthase/dihydrofolate synthase [Nitrospirales bacterium]